MTPARLRLLLDGTAYLDRRTGVGTFLSEVSRRLVRRGDLEVTAFAMTLLGFGELERRVPLGVHAFTRPLPAPQLRRRWAEHDGPPIEWWTGAVDVVHGPNFLVPPTRAAAQVVTVHDLTPVHFPELCTDEVRSYPLLIERAIARGAFVHTVSEHVADEVRAHFAVDPDRVVAIRNGPTPVAPADPARGRALVGTATYVLAVGTVEPRKDLPTLVAAFDRLAADAPDLRLVIAGSEGWGSDDLDVAVARAHARDRVVRLGRVDDADRAALLRGAAVLAYPSRYEGFGLPPLEAMAAGTPVVATRAGAIPEAVGDAALLVDVGDADELADALASVLADPTLAASLVARGTENLARFSWDTTADALVALYRRAVAERPAPRGPRRPVVTLDAPPGRQGGDPAAPDIVRAVVLNHDGGDLVRRSVEALLASEVPAGLRLEVVVVDNASTDGSAEAVRDLHPEVLVVHNVGNTGFPANNLALRDLEGVVAVALVNDDAFVEPGWLAPLLAELEADDTVGAACPCIVLDDRFAEVEVVSPTFVPGGGDERDLGVVVSGVRVRGIDRWADVRVGGVDHGLEHGREGTFRWTGGRTVLRLPVPPEPGPVPAAVRLSAPSPTDVVLRSGAAARSLVVTSEPRWFDIEVGEPIVELVNNAGGVVFADGYGADRGYLDPVGAPWDEPADVFAFCGGAVLLRPRFLDEVGLLDTRFFLYYEDTDLSWRGQARGWRYRYVPTSRVRHRHSATAGEGSPLAQHYGERNRLLMLAKNAPPGLLRAEVEGYARSMVDDATAVARRVARRRRPDAADLARLRHLWRRQVAAVDALRQAPFIIRRRRRLRRQQTVPDAVVLAKLSPRDPATAHEPPPARGG